MSANNQTLVKEHNGKWLVFQDVQAESWDEINTIEASKADTVCDTEQEAYINANHLNKQVEWPCEIEYGVSDTLIKDGAEVKII